MDQVLDALLVMLPYLELPGIVVAAIMALIVILKRSGATQSRPQKKKESWPPKDFWDDMANRN